MKAIQKELGEGEDGLDELGELEDRIAKTKLSKEAREKCELRKLKTSESRCRPRRRWCGIILIGCCPFRGRSHQRYAMTSSRRKVLDADHYGLGKVKERIIEYLAVQQRTRKLKGPILCLVGPPGVGKTSLGSIDRQSDTSQLCSRVFGRRSR